MGSITATDLPENFSFSCYELDSTIINDRNDDDNESYIEINLEQTQDFKEFELRISISSVPVAELTRSTQGLCEELYRHEGREASGAKTQILSSGGSEPTVISTAEISSCRGVPKRKFLNQKVKFFDPVNDRAQENGHAEFLGSRGKKPSKVASAFNSGVMKLFIKLRSGSILTTFMSLIKSYHSFSHQSRIQNSKRMTQEIRIYGRLTNQFHRWWPQINNNMNIVKRRGNSNNSSDGKSSVKLKESEVNSSPSSINSSPVRSSLNVRMSCSERENSVRAAIDHCKRSL